MKNRNDTKSIKKFFLDMFKDHKKELIVITVISSIGALFAVVVPYLYGRLFDLALIPNTPIILLLSLIGIWVISTLITDYTSSKTTMLGDVLGAKIALKSEAEAYGHFLTLPIAFHKKKRSGTIIEKISKGSWNIASMVESSSDIFPQILTLILAIVIMLIIQWQLALAIILFFIIYAVFTIKMTGTLIESQENLHKVFEKQYGEVYDKVYNVFLVKNFTLEEKEKKRFFNSLVEKTKPVITQNAKKWARMSFYQSVIFSLSFVIVLSMAIFFLRNNMITPGEFIMFFGYIGLSFAPFFKLSFVFRQFKRSSVAINRIIKLKKMVPEAMKHGNEIIKDVKGEIEFRNLNFSYTKKRDILKNINLKIKAGETVAIVGESGVGKTTLSELMFGYYQPSKGEVLLDGVNISKLKLQFLREQIAIVPQEISMFNDTLLNNIKYSNPKSSLEDIIKAAKAAYAHEFIMSLPKKYNTLVGERGIKLSTGQKQRIALTMAFLKNPKILMLDEPTSALDANSEVKVQEGINRLISGRTTIIIAHRFSTVRNADKIVVLDKGKIIEVGNHYELMRKKGKYYQLYKLQKGLD